MTANRPRAHAAESPRPRRIETRPAVVAWQPDIVLATTIASAPPQPTIVMAEPGARPEAVDARLGTARSLLAALGQARETLGAAAAEAQIRATGATSTRERVSATIAAYRAEAALDGVLQGTWRQVSALMEERGLR